MGSRLADRMGMAAAPQTVEVMTANAVKNVCTRAYSSLVTELAADHVKIDELSEATSGKFVNYDGLVLGW